MPQFEVTFTVYKSNESGKAAVASSSTTNMKTVVEARHSDQARAMIRGQYGPTCSVHSARPV